MSVSLWRLLKLSLSGRMREDKGFNLEGATGLCVFSLLYVYDEYANIYIYAFGWLAPIGYDISFLKLKHLVHNGTSTWIRC